MDALVTYGSGSEESEDNNSEQQQEQEQASREEGDIDREIPVSETSTPMDLPPSSRVPLPLELNCEIFKCLKLPVQRKFIWGLGREALLLWTTISAYSVGLAFALMPPRYVHWRSFGTRQY